MEEKREEKTAKEKYFLCSFLSFSPPISLLFITPNINSRKNKDEAISTVSDIEMHVDIYQLPIGHELLSPD